MKMNAFCWYSAVISMLMLSSYVADVSAGYGCKEIHQNGSQDGVYSLTLLSTPFQAYCKQGWIVIQRRIDSSVDFDRNWSEYTNGFGTPDKEYWLGLEKLHQLTQNQKWRLRVDLVGQNGITAFQTYNNFKVGDAASNYKLTLDGGNSGTAGDSLTPTKDFATLNWGHQKMNLNGQAFSTTERDNDKFSGSCSTTFSGHGWWNKECFAGSLNGKNGTNGFSWYSWKNTFQTDLAGASMSIQPVSPDCSFERDICSWTQDTTDDLDWIRQSAPDPYSGPSEAHDGTYYMYRKPYYQVKPGQKARLISPTFQPTQESCFTFWYRLTGYYTNKLNVLLTGSSGDLTLWSRSNSQGDFWQLAQIRLGNASYSSYSKIVFETIQVDHNGGGIAVDDVTLTPGTCQDVNECASSLTNVCEEVCVNTAEFYTCACNNHYVLNDNKRTCAIPNVAMNKPASQSTLDAKYGRPERVVEGDRMTHIAWCTHTASNDTNPYRWWRVDLQGQYQIPSVIITNSHSSIISGNSLMDFDINVSPYNDTPSQPTPGATTRCLHKNSPVSMINPEKLDCTPSPVVGRYVTLLISNSSKPLHFCELEVFALPYVPKSGECFFNSTDDCEQLCVNTGGSHTCACRRGYTLNADKLTCSGNRGNRG